MRRVSADVTWENRRRDSQTVYFESDDPEAGLGADPHAFLAATAAPALSRSERRILVEGSVCPRFRDGLTTALKTLVAWQRPTRPLPRIEATGGFAPIAPTPGAGAAVLLSGGLDSLALLHKNRVDFPSDHPRSYTTAIFVHGFDIEEDDAASVEFYARAHRSLESAATDAGVRLVPVRTNVKTLGSRWAEEHQGGAMAAAGHACTGRVRTLDVASSYTWGTVFPYGSHPILDLHYSSDALTVRHADVNRGRLEKLQLLAEWPAGLRSLRVCWEGVPGEGSLNCGSCHKCFLTLLELVAVDAFDACPTFPVAEVTREVAEGLKAHQRSSIPFFAELLRPLRDRGRDDLAAVVQRKIRLIEAHLARRDERPLWRRVFRRRGA